MSQYIVYEMMLNIHKELQSIHTCMLDNEAIDRKKINKIVNKINIGRIDNYYMIYFYVSYEYNDPLLYNNKQQIYILFHFFYTKNSKNEID